MRVVQGDDLKIIPPAQPFEMIPASATQPDDADTNGIERVGRSRHGDVSVGTDSIRVTPLPQSFGILRERVLQPQSLPGINSSRPNRTRRILIRRLSARGIISSRFSGLKHVWPMIGKECLKLLGLA